MACKKQVIVKPHVLQRIKATEKIQVVSGVKRTSKTISILDMW